MKLEKQSIDDDDDDVLLCVWSSEGFMTYGEVWKLIFSNIQL